MEQITREPASCCRCLSYTRLKVVWRRPGHDWIQGLAVTLRFKPLLSKRAFGTVAFFWARRIINKTQAGEIHMKSLWAATMNPRLWWKLLHFCFKKENCFLSESCLHAELKSFPEAPSAQCKPSVTIVSNSINLSCISAPLYAETVLCLNIDWMHFNPIITFNPKKWQIQRGSFGLIGRKGLIAVQSRDLEAEMWRLEQHCVVHPPQPKAFWIENVPLAGTGAEADRWGGYRPTDISGVSLSAHHCWGHTKVEAGAGFWAQWAPCDRARPGHEHKKNQTTQWVHFKHCSYTLVNFNNESGSCMRIYNALSSTV